MKKRLKINGVIMFCVFLLLAAFPGAFFRSDKITAYFAFDQCVEIFGIALILLGQLLRVSSRGYKAEHSGEGNILIQAGPYSLVRNPMYLGILLIGFGIIALLFKWWTIGVLLLVFITRYASLILQEEEKLKAKFPREYPGYQQKAPRLLPSIIMLWHRPVSEYLPLKLPWLKKEIGSMLCVLFLALLARSWIEIKEKGREIYFPELIASLIIIILFILLVIYLTRRTANAGKNVSNTGKNTL